jgi:hypothetical protein
MDRIPTEKDRDRQAIAAQVAAFLARGGEVIEVPPTEYKREGLSTDQRIRHGLIRPPVG